MAGEQVTKVMNAPDSAPAAGSCLCRVEAIPDGGAHGVSAFVNGVEEALILLRSGEVVKAFHNVCPHAGRALDWAPGRFLVESGLVICAAHGATFAIPDGRCVLGPCRGQSLVEVPVRCAEGEVRLV